MISKGTPETRDFTLAKYRELCDTLIGNGYRILTVKSFFELKENTNNKGKIAILRHDVDRGLKNALRMAKLEHEMGIASTYYFRYPYTFVPEKVKEIEAMGHEIGYHYETLAKAHGDFEQAIHLFREELEAMRRICPIDTICMHGSPLSRYDNRDLWKKYDFREYSIIGEAYLSMPEMEYLSDTGRNWNGANTIKDRLFDREVQYRFSDTNSLIQNIKQKPTSTLYFNIHPERWSASTIEWVFSAIQDLAFNTGKIICRIYQ